MIKEQNKMTFEMIKEQNKMTKEQNKMTEEQKNRNFIQLYRNHIDDMAKLARNNGKAYDLLMLLIKHMDGTNALCVSNKTLQELLECGKATVCRAVNYLKDNGWICILKSGTSNVYIVNPEVAWTSYGTQKKYCKFNANVLLSSSENAEWLKNYNASTHFKTINDDFVQTVQKKEKEFQEKCDNIKNITI